MNKVTKEQLKKGEIHICHNEYINTRLTISMLSKGFKVTDEDSSFEPKCFDTLQCLNIYLEQSKILDKYHII